MIEHCIRLSDQQEAFYYSIRRDGVVAEIEAVAVAAVAESDIECEYFGGSQAMD